MHSFAPARASLAKIFTSLSQRHAAAYASWRDSPAPSPALAVPQQKCGAFVAPVRGVSFDLDDTLFPTMPAIAAASKRLAAALELSMPNAHAAGAGDAMQLRDAIRDVAEREPLLAHDFTELRRAALLKLASAHGDPLHSVDDVRRALHSVFLW